MSGNLGITQIAATQNQKEVTANAALLRLDAAMTDLLSVSVSAGNATLTTAQFQTAVAFVVTGATVAGRTVTVPASRRLFVVEADAANTRAIAVVRGTTSRSLAPGQSALLYTDGTANGLDVVSHSALSGLRNRVVNPAMQISQERGTAFVDCTTGVTFAIDQWQALLTFQPGGTLRVQRVASLTPAGSPWRLRATVQATDTSISAGDLYALSQSLEGNMTAGARFGSGDARDVLLRFGVRSSIAGTFGISVRNGSGTRAWLGTITIDAGDVNTDLVRQLVIPGDTTGTWFTDAVVGFSLGFTLAAGSGFQGVAGWQAGNLLTTSAQTNLLATAGATFELFDVGLYVDTLGLQLFPPFEVPAVDQDLRACQRYWRPLVMSEVFTAAAANENAARWQSFDPPMRVAPVVANNADGAPSNLLVAQWDNAQAGGARVLLTSAAAGVASITGRTGSANARL